MFNTGTENLFFPLSAPTICFDCSLTYLAFKDATLVFGRHYKGNREELITTETLNEPGNIQIYAQVIKVLLLFSQHKENMTFLDRLDVHPLSTHLSNRYS